mmetsp:Transcript_3742/g.6375  ORF Transcript_3742/g.6375 Transcript_3742/m.6375 type:complete len:84 (-) Transcript_3742:336-587(-)
MTNDTMTLEGYGAKNNYCIHVVDNNPNAKSFLGEFEDVSKVEKYVMDDKDYEKRADTFRKFRERQLQTNPNFKSYMGEVDKDY